MNEHLLPDMVKIPAGEVSLRDDRTKRAWTENLEPFFLCIHPVTQDLYRAITKQSPSVFTGERCPVDSVSWYDAVRFCNLLSVDAGLTEVYELDGDRCNACDENGTNGFRLPTDAEWEYACKAGNTKPSYGLVDEIAWFESNSSSRSHEVGLKKPNSWGLHDMLGNVWEWCWDLYDPDVYGQYRIFRGGGWSDQERGCLATNRRRSHPTFRIDDLGFRVARSI